MYTAGLYLQDGLLRGCSGMTKSTFDHWSDDALLSEHKSLLKQISVICDMPDWFDCHRQGVGMRVDMVRNIETVLDKRGHRFRPNRTKNSPYSEKETSSIKL